MLTSVTFATVGYVGKLAFLVERVDVIASISIAEIDILAVRWCCEPSRAVGRACVLPEVAIDLPNDGAVEMGLCQFLIVIGVVKEDIVALVRDFEAMRRPRAKSAVSPCHELSSCSIRLPTDETVLIAIRLTGVLVRKVNVGFSVRDQTMTICHVRSRRWDEKVWHVLVAKLSLSTDDRSSMGISIRRQCVNSGSEA